MIQPTDVRSLHQPDPEPLTQLRAATTLVVLIQEDAPAADWRLAEDGRSLRGQLLSFNADDVARRAGIAAWQRVIGAGPVEARVHLGREHLVIEGSYEGVPVEVSTIVDKQTDLEKRLAAAVDDLGELGSLSTSALREILGGGDAA